MYNFSVLCLFFIFFFSVIPEGEGAGIIEILAKWILEACFSIGAWASFVLLMLRGEKEGEQKLE